MKNNTFILIIMIIVMIIVFLYSPRYEITLSAREPKGAWNLLPYQRKVNIVVLRKKTMVKQTTAGCIMGELHVNGKYFCATLERPFSDSENFVSSIPRGTYKATLRYKKDKHQWRIQLTDTSYYIFNYYDPFTVKKKVKRSGIQIHPGTKPGHTMGCILVGEKKGDRCRLFNSHNTFDRLLRTYFGSSRFPDQNIEITVAVRAGFNSF